MDADLQDKLHDLEVRIARLKVLYEHYFLGFEKSEPLVARKEIVRIFQELKESRIRNTGDRFLYNNLVYRWNTFTTKWQKTMREIELGTYLPHLQRVKRRGGDLPDELDAKIKKRGDARLRQTPALSEPHDDAATPPRGVPAVRKTPPPLPPVDDDSPIPGMNQAELRALHARYQEALRASGKPTQVKFETLVSSLERQVPSVLERHRCRALTFDVQTQNGEVVLKATPKR